jgi:3'(2'), 5'-bisphosphate nucleotidase
VIPLDDLRALHTAALQIVREAGQCVMTIYGSDFETFEKADATPVTRADTLADALIVARLAALAPALPVVSEESSDAMEPGMPPGDLFWLVDPLDGTREFIQRNGEFTVNIALIRHGEPMLGVVLAPALGQLYSGIPGIGAWLDDATGTRLITSRRAPEEGLTVLGSRSHGSADALAHFLASRHVARTRAVGSSLKLCLLAAGEADVYPRFGATMEWDIAAGHAVLAAAGGRIEQLDGSRLTYGKPGFSHPPFIAWGQRG